MRSENFSWCFTITKLVVYVLLLISLIETVIGECSLQPYTLPIDKPHCLPINVETHKCSGGCPSVSYNGISQASCCVMKNLTYIPIELNCIPSVSTHSVTYSNPSSCECSHCQ